jgi:hypothetical protein
MDDDASARALSMSRDVDGERERAEHLGPSVSPVARLIDLQSTREASSVDIEPLVMTRRPHSSPFVRMRDTNIPCAGHASVCPLFVS